MILEGVLDASRLKNIYNHNCQISYLEECINDFFVNQMFNTILPRSHNAGEAPGRNTILKPVLWHASPVCNRLIGFKNIKYIHGAKKK